MQIGFFDSGLGGLTILKAVSARLPEYNYLFYGDTLHLPYGAKSEEEIYELTKTGCVWLFERGVLLIIVACNTASAQTLRKLQDEFLPEYYPEKRILGVIIPTIETLIESNSKKATLIATKRTIDSEKYTLELEKFNSPIELSAIATPELVPLLEAGEIDKAYKKVKPIVTKTIAHGDDTFVLGCTHYVLLKDRIRSDFGDKIRVISQDEVIPNKLAQYLSAHPEIASLVGKGTDRVIHLTQNRADYDRITVDLLGSQYV